MRLDSLLSRPDSCPTNGVHLKAPLILIGIYCGLVPHVAHFAGCRRPSLCHMAPQAGREMTAESVTRRTRTFAHAERFSTGGGLDSTHDPAFGLSYRESQLSLGLSSHKLIKETNNLPIA